MLTATLPDGGRGRALERVRLALEAHGCQPRGWPKMRARCPVHEGRGMSLPLSASQGRAGALLHCFALDCPVGEIRLALDLSWDDLYDEPRPRDQPQPARPPTAPDPLGGLTDTERLFLRGLRAMPVFWHWYGQVFAHLVANWTDPGPWEERVQAAEDDCRAEADARYWRFMARCSALATDEVYVRRAYRQREDKPLRLSPEQCEVLRMRAEDLAREAGR